MSKSSLRRRFAAGLVGAFAAATALVATSAGTATAATTCATAVTLSTYTASNAYGDYNRISADTSSTTPGCGTPYEGTTTLEKWNGSAWVSIATSSGASYASYNGAFNSTATYRARYSGGTNSSGSFTWQPSSAAKTVAVFRDVTETHRSVRGGVKFTIKIAPANSIAGSKVLFQVKKGAKWKKYKAVKAKANGKVVATFAAPSRKKTHYRMVLPTRNGLIGTTHRFWTRRY